MDSLFLQTYGLPAAIVLFFVWRSLQNRKVRKQMPSLIEEGAVIVDVRSPAEYAGGSAAGSINIPLDQLEKRASNLDRGKTVIVCCASGARSAMAATILKNKGFQKVVNAGPWRNACG